MNNSNNRIVIKLQYNGDIRRVRVEDNFSPTELIDLIKVLYKLETPSLSYIDEDNDHVNICLPMDWDEALHYGQRKSPLRLGIENNGSIDSINSFIQGQIRQSKGPVIQSNIENRETEAIETFSESLLQLERAIKPEYMNWKSEEDHVIWISLLESTNDFESLFELLKSFCECYSENLDSFCNRETSPLLIVKQTGRFNKIFDILRKIESNIPWANVTSNWSDIRDDWLKSLTNAENKSIATLSKEQKDQILSNSLKVYVKSLIEFENYLIDDVKTWKDDEERIMWISSEQSCDNITKVLDMTKIFLEHISEDKSYVQNLITGTGCVFDALVESSSIDSLISFLLSLECSIPWSDVTSDFSDARSTWTSNLRDAEHDIYDCIIKEFNDDEDYLNLVKTKLIYFINVITPSYYNWENDSKKQIFLENLSNISTVKDLAILLTEFNSKLPCNYYNIVNRTLNLYEIAQVLLSIETCIPWSGVYPRFKIERRQWRDALSRIPYEEHVGVEEKSYNITLEDNDTLEFSFSLIDNSQLLDFEFNLGSSGTIEFNKESQDNNSGYIKFKWDNNEIMHSNLHSTSNNTYNCSISFTNNLLSLTINDLKFSAINIPNNNSLTNISRISTIYDSKVCSLNSLKHNYSRSQSLI